jgi:hypothetical protein
MRSLNDLLAALDISDQIGRGLTLVRRMDNPVGCFVLVAILVAINALLWPWIWYFDIDSTREFGEAHARMIQEMPVPVPVPDPALAGILLAGGCCCRHSLKWGLLSWAAVVFPSRRGCCNCSHLGGITL